MTYRGYSVLAFISLAVIVAAVVCGLTGALNDTWPWLGFGGVLGLAGVGLSVLSVLDSE